jgi:hypothetical protein
MSERRAMMVTAARLRQPQDATVIAGARGRRCRSPRRRTPKWHEIVKNAISAVRPIERELRMDGR